MTLPAVSSATRSFAMDAPTAAASTSGAAPPEYRDRLQGQTWGPDEVPGSTAARRALSRDLGI
jgi:hypothetical protein